MKKFLTFQALSMLAMPVIRAQTSSVESALNHHADLQLGSTGDRDVMT